MTAYSSPHQPGPFADLRFTMSLRKYQQMVLDVVARNVDEGQSHKHHIVAPPGSGKTIVGLELIHRFGQPAVVFAPTTTIQRQWQDKAGLFTADAEWLAQHTSLESARLADMTFLTYQVLSTPGEHLAFVERVAIERWVDDLLRSGKAETEAEAQRRIDTILQSNPDAHRREVAKRYRRVKRQLLHDPAFDGRALLHPNARDLIDRIVAQGTGTIVLDECHHLLDYWAFILRELIKALPNAHVIGLTATLPDPENQVEYENYDSLLGAVDFQVPTPAVVKEGNLAPYRDLVYFCEPSPREHSYLADIQAHFETAVQQVTETLAFQDWLWDTLVERQRLDDGPDTPPEPFEALFNREPALCVAGIKYLLWQEIALPPDIPLIEDMLEPLNVDDWLTLLENFGLRVLTVSAAPDHQDLYRDLRTMLLAFGITISEQGVRHHRSPGDLVLTLSESKDQATIDILRAESEELGDRLRAVVLTDYERMSARTRRLSGILDPDAGSAVRVFRRLIGDPATNVLDPILVTGKVVLVNADNRDKLTPGITAWLAARDLRCDWEWRPTDDDQVLELAGSGPDWSSRTYVAMLTELFEQGLARCLVGTRGIFGEGWDALSLNTLIDLTSVTTSTSVQQIRGRSLRLDPARPRKVAHNWDVVCYSPRFDKGDMDLRRLVVRHAHTWGLVVCSQAQEIQDRVGSAMQGQPPAQPARGRIVRGLPHIDLDLAFELGMRDFKQVNFAKYTRRMLRAVRDRDHIYDLWGVGEPYSNFIYSATQIVARDVKFRTAYTIQESLRALVWRTLVSILALALTIWFNLFVIIPWSGTMPLPALALGLGALTGVAAVGAVTWNARGIWRVLRRAFLEMPVDAVLLDMGRALLRAMSETGAVSHNLNADYVRVIETETGGYEVLVDYASPEDSAAFAEAYRELLGRIGDARYLIERNSTSLRNPAYRLLWLLVRTLVGRGDEVYAYHRVPDALAARKERAEILGRYWQQYVGGGRLIYTRTAEGRRILLQVRALHRQPIRQMAFEIWK
ncbi:MAG: DEAD/DEAH box helicase family protein [Chloroflexi bacterium]|nr:DEAD/DEAH box helicase family protein [Chloroflexota bacterium]